MHVTYSVPAQFNWASKWVWIQLSKIESYSVNTISGKPLSRSFPNALRAQSEESTSFFAGSVLACEAGAKIANLQALSRQTHFQGGRIPACGLNLTVALQTNSSFEKTDLALGMVAFGFGEAWVREWKAALVNIDACNLQFFVVTSSSNSFWTCASPLWVPLRQLVQVRPLELEQLHLNAVPAVARAAGVSFATPLPTVFQILPDLLLDIHHPKETWILNAIEYLQVALSLKQPQEKSHPARSTPSKSIIHSPFECIELVKKDHPVAKIHYLLPRHLAALVQNDCEDSCHDFEWITEMINHDSK